MSPTILRIKGIDSIFYQMKKIECMSMLYVQMAKQNIGWNQSSLWQHIINLNRKD